MWFKVCFLSVVLFCFLSDEILSMNQQDLIIGKRVTQPKNGWDAKVYGPDFLPRSNTIVELEIDEKRVIFFQDDRSRNVSLFMSEDGNLRSLWEGKNMTPFSIIPSPVLISEKLSENEIPELLLVYADDCGTGQGSDCWRQEMRLFFDWQPGGNEPIPLSSIDRYLTADAYGIGEDGGPATAQEALVLIFPAFKEQVCTIYVWSRKTVFEHPPSGTAQTLSYSIVVF